MAKIVQLKDRNNLDICPVGAATATYMEDGNSVQTILLQDHVIIDIINAALSDIKNTVNIINIDLHNSLRGIPYILKNQDEIELTLVGGYTYIWQSPIASLSFDLELVEGVETHYRMKFIPQTGFIFTSVKELKGTIPEWIEGKLYEVDIVSDPTENYITVKEL